MAEVEVFSELYPPPDRPWTDDYAATHQRFVADMLDDPDVVARFARGESLPDGYGVGLDERVVEIPWLLSRGLGGRTLDAGSALNHAHILDRVLARVSDVHVVTLEPEERAFPEKRVSYVFADLRHLPYRDGWFDATVCISTLEHVGMDNTYYGVALPRADDPGAEVARALAELDRVTARSGHVFVTVPYGRQEDHGWFRQFSRTDVEAVLRLVPRPVAVSVFAYAATGWQVSELDPAADAAYRDYTADSSPVEDRAAAARAVACIAVGPRPNRSRAQALGGSPRARSPR